MMREEVSSPTSVRWVSSQLNSNVPLNVAYMANVERRSDINSSCPYSLLGKEMLIDLPFSSPFRVIGRLSSGRKSKASTTTEAIRAHSGHCFEDFISSSCVGKNTTSFSEFSKRPTKLIFRQFSHSSLLQKSGSSFSFPLSNPLCPGRVIVSLFPGSNISMAPDGLKHLNCPPRSITRCLNPAHSEHPSRSHPNTTAFSVIIHLAKVKSLGRESNTRELSIGGVMRR